MKIAALFIHGNKPCLCIKSVNFLHYVSVCWLLKACGIMSQLIYLKYYFKYLTHFIIVYVHSNMSVV